MMIESHYSLNVARKGFHFARVELPTNLDRTETIYRAQLITGALQAADAEITTSLQHIVCSGHSVEIV